MKAVAPNPRMRGFGASGFVYNKGMFQDSTAEKSGILRGKVSCMRIWSLLCIY